MIARGWAGLLRYNGLTDFEAVWALPLNWLDEPNRGRGGWSGVSKHELPTADGAQVSIILKRQENYSKKTWRHPVKGIPTLRAEMETSKRLWRRGVPVPEVMYFGESGRRAALITLTLLGFRPLDAVAQELAGVRALTHKRALIRAAAFAVRKMHDARCQHRALFPKHLLVCMAAEGSPIYIIDLEKARHKPFFHQCLIHDLDELNRRSAFASRGDRMRFFKDYLGVGMLGTWDKFLCARILRRGARKQISSASRSAGALKGSSR